MLAHNIKEVLTLAPEAFNLVKEASLDKDFPVDNKSSVAASFLVATYLEKVAHRSISESVFSLIKKAVDLYGLAGELEPLVCKFDMVEKQASAGDSFTVDMQEFEDSLTGWGYTCLEKTAAAAEELVSKYGDQVTSENALQYSCSGWLNKEAAVQSLANRVVATKGSEPGYIKIARLVANDMGLGDQASLKDLCRTVTLLDKQAGLDLLGFNFYREAVMLKTAGVGVMVAGESIPFEKIVKFGKDRIGASIGSDVASALTGDVVNDKAIIESLPRDLQLVLKASLKNV